MGGLGGSLDSETEADRAKCQVLKRSHTGLLEGKDTVHQQCQEGNCTGSGGIRAQQMAFLVQVEVPKDKEVVRKPSSKGLESCMWVQGA